MKPDAMTVADLITLLQQSEDPQAPITVRVWDNQTSEEPVFSRCTVRDVQEIKGVVVVDVEEV